MGRLLVTMVCLVLLAFTVVVIRDVPLTGMAVASLKSPQVFLNVSSPLIANDPVAGFVTFNFSGPAAARSAVKVMVGNVSKDYSLVSLLENASFEVVVAPRSVAAANPSAVKVLAFADGGDQSVAVRLPKSADVKAISFAVEGAAVDGVAPLAPSVDLGGDGFQEFSYVGALSGFGAVVVPDGFSSGAESSIIMKDDARYYCEILNLSQARDFEFSAKYGPYASGVVGNISFALFSFAGSGASIAISGGADTCDLPELSNVGVGSCRVSLKNPLSGRYVACVTNMVRSNQNKNVYSLVTDQVASSTSYSCQFFAGSGTCSAISNGHFSLSVKAGQYVGRLSSKVLLKDAATQYSAVEALKKSLLSCTADDWCVVPVVVSSQSKGKLFLSDLVISYVSQGVDKEEKSWYDGAVVPEVIQSVDSLDLSSGKGSVVIPLADLNLLPRRVDVGKNVSVKVFIDDVVKASVSVRVEKQVALNGTLTRIDRAKSSLNALDKSLLAKLGLSASFIPVLASLDSLRSRLVVLSSNVSANKVKEFDSITADLDTLLVGVPADIHEVRRVTDSILVSPADLAGFERADALATVQRAYSVKGTVRVYQVNYFDGSTQLFSVVEKQVSGSLNGAQIAERFLSGVVDPAEVIFDGPVVTQDDYVTFAGRNAFSYAVPGDVSLGLNDLKTIVLADPQVVDDVAAIQHICGDNKCTSLKVNDRVVALEDALSCPVDCKKKVPYLWFIIVGVIIIVGLYYIYFYHGKGSLFKKKAEPALFRTKLDEASLVAYVKKTLEKKLDRSKVEPMLVVKGWSKKQIDFAFKEATKASSVVKK